MIRDKLSKVKNKLDDIDDWRREQRRKRAGVKEEELQSTIEDARGDSINRETLLRAIDSDSVPFNLLDEGEQPHFLLNGSTIDVEGQGAGSESIIGWDRDRRFGAVYSVLTEERILVIANHARGYDEHTIPYDSVTAVNRGDGLTSRRLSIQTKSATYHCSISKTRRVYGKDEEEAAVKYLRDNQESNGDSDGTSEDPLNRLEKLKDLHDDGVLSDEEFEEKKESLLSEV